MRSPGSKETFIYCQTFKWFNIFMQPVLYPKNWHPPVPELSSPLAHCHSVLEDLAQNLKGKEVCCLILVPELLGNSLKQKFIFIFMSCAIFFESLVHFIIPMYHVISAIVRP